MWRLSHRCREGSARASVRAWRAWSCPHPDGAGGRAGRGRPPQAPLQTGSGLPRRSRPASRARAVHFAGWRPQGAQRLVLCSVMAILKLLLIFESPGGVAGPPSAGLALRVRQSAPGRRSHHESYWLSCHNDSAHPVLTRWLCPARRAPGRRTVTGHPLDRLSPQRHR